MFQKYKWFPFVQLSFARFFLASKNYLLQNSQKLPPLPQNHLRDYTVSSRSVIDRFLFCISSKIFSLLPSKCFFPNELVPILVYYHFTTFYLERKSFQFVWNMHKIDNLYRTCSSYITTQTIHLMLTLLNLKKKSLCTPLWLPLLEETRHIPFIAESVACCKNLSPHQWASHMKKTKLGLRFSVSPVSKLTACGH